MTSPKSFAPAVHLAAELMGQMPRDVVIFCDHHGRHLWLWGNLNCPIQTDYKLRKSARVQMQTLCPSAGDILAWQAIRQHDVGHNDNWTLRHGAKYLQPEELAIAQAIQ